MLIPVYPRVLSLSSLLLDACYFHITSALPDQGTQLRWQNSTDKEDCQRHALWPAVFYRFFLIPDPLPLSGSNIFQLPRDRSPEAINYVLQAPTCHNGSGISCSSRPGCMCLRPLIIPIRDQASNPIFNVVSPHTRAGFGLIPDPLRYKKQLLLAPNGSGISCCPVQERIFLHMTIQSQIRIGFRDLYYSGLYPAVTTSDPRSIGSA